MKKSISFALFVGFTLLLNLEVFSQVAESGGNNSTLFNEGGYVQGLTLARVVGLVELALGLAKKGAKIALTLGLGAVVFSAVHFFITAGAVFGSGSGKAGAIIAFVLGLIGVILAYLTLRSQNAEAN